MLDTSAVRADHVATEGPFGAHGDLVFALQPPLLASGCRNDHVEFLFDVGNQREVTAPEPGRLPYSAAPDQSAAGMTPAPRISTTARTVCARISVGERFLECSESARRVPALPGPIPKSGVVQPAPGSTSG